MIIKATEEKIEAGVQSAQAMAAHMMTMSQPRGALAFRHMLRNSAPSARRCDVH
jgi:hypothetical protein